MHKGKSYKDRYRAHGMKGNLFLRPMVLILCLLAFLSSGEVLAQQHTVRGRVVDASTNETLPFVQIVVRGTSNGVVSDMDGRFRILCADTNTVLEISMMGYESQSVAVAKNNNLKIQLRPSSHNLKEVEVKARRRHNRYRRKDNPAVDLMKEVIAHKPQNHIDNLEFYDCEKYVKTNLALDDFHPNFQRHIFWKHLPFVENYIDQSPFDNTPILNVYVSESMTDKRHKSNPVLDQNLLTATRSDGIGVSLQNEGVVGSSNDFFPPMDIYQNEIVLFDYHFVSPLSDFMANATYHYFITDTVVLDSLKCVELAFTPVNPNAYAFSGRMYIVDDSSYAVKRVEMAIAPHANLNFIAGMNILLDYKKGETGILVPSRDDIYARLSLTPRIKMLRQIYLHQATVFSDFSFRDTLSAFPDSLFDRANSYAALPEASKVKREQWNSMRPIPIPQSELLVDSFRYEFMKVPFMKRLSKFAMITATGYIPTNPVRDSSKFDFGSIYNFYSINAIEGVRLRVGGMTKAALNRQNFAQGFLAYGLSDEKFKYNLTLTHTFDEKKRHAGEHPFNALSFTASYDVESPGLAFTLFDHDNILMENTSRMMEYVGNAELRFQKQWKTALSLDTRFTVQNHQPTGDLTYYSLLADGSNARVDSYNTLEWNSKIFFSPKAKTKDGRGKGGVTNQLNHPFSLTLEHSMGWFEGFYYNRTLFTAHKIFWLTPLGYLDVQLEAGKVWNQVPLPKLFFPAGNASFYMMQGSFNTMKPMEFAADQQVSLFATYHLRGLILSHVPIVRRFNLREVASFNLYWGSLSERNDPTFGQEGLFLLPSATQRLNNVPFMEYSIGVENIFKCIRIDYVKRLTYLEGAPAMDGWRLGLQLSL